MARLGQNEGQVAPAPFKRAIPESFPRLSPYPNFMYMAHPEQWVILHGLVCPRLAQIAIQPGVNRVDADGDATDAISMKQRRGWIPIHTDIDADGDPTADGERHVSYVRAHRVRAKGKRDQDYEPSQFAHLPRWCKVYKNSAQISEGGEDFAKWSRALVDRGVVADIQPHVVERMLEESRRLLEEYSAKGLPKYQPHIKKCNADIEVLEALMGEHEAADEAVVPPKPRIKSKVARGE